MAITNHPRAYDGASQRRYLVTPTGRKVWFRVRSEDPLPGGPYTLIQLAVLPIRAALGTLVLACSAYLLLFVCARLFPADQNIADGPARVLAAKVGEVFAEMRDGVGYFAALGGTPSPLTAAIVGGGALVGGSVLKSVSLSLAASRIRSRMDRDLIRAENVAISARPSPASERLDDGAAAAARDRARRISGVHDALAQLDAEWLAYERDLEAYYLTKPVLRDLGVAETAAYRSALFEPPRSR